MGISSPGWATTGNAFLNSANNYFLLANILVIVFSLISLFRPREWLWFWLSIFFLTVVKLDALPGVPNHLILTLIIHFTLFLSVLLYWNGSLETQKERISYWFKKTAPYLRIELLIVYFFVVLHKLNYDFFNPDVSCAAELYNDIAGMYPFFPQELWIDKAIIFLTLLPELLIPILLIIPATRVFGVFIGLLFHFMLSLHSNLYILSFSAEVYALYILFLPGHVITKCTHELKQIADRFSKEKLLAGVAGIGLTVSVFYLGINILLTGTLSVSQLKEDIMGLIMVFWIIWSITLIAGAIAVFRGHFISFPPETSSFFRLSWSPLLLLLLLTIFNGINPYIGLKTATNFAMFSNLKVEGADNNHLFISSAYQLSGKQGDTVTLIETNHPYLQNYIDWNERITYFELSRFLHENRSKNVEVTFRRNSNKQTIRLPQQQPTDYMDSSWLARKMLVFRGVPIEGPTPCQW
ncbi:MAG: hypothetical protein WD059_00245 [Balneolaceae bacterium]